LRSITYAEAIREGFQQILEADPNVFAIGQGVWSPWYVGTTMKDLDREFGRHRIIDTPVSENATTGAAVGAALAGMRPIVIHPRMDFMLLAVDQIINQAANWYYMTGGRVNVPITVRAIVNRGGEQAAQHSQSVHAWFMHVPGLKVAMPSTPYDAKGMLIASVRDENPVLYIDDRWLYNDAGEVPEDPYEVPLGEAVVRREGRDATVVAVSVMAREALKAAAELQKKGIELEVIDLRSLKPLDRSLILQSLRKTGRLLAADTGWPTCGVSAEIAALAASEGHAYLKAPVIRVSLPDVPAPMSKPLEEAYYPGARNIAAAAEKLMSR